MSMLKKIITAFAAMFAAATLMTAYAADPAIEQAKAQGVIGELYTGYLAIVDASKATPDLKRRVDEVNAGRLQAYTDIATKQNQSVQVVGQLMAQKQAERAQSGELIKPSASEPWTKKQ
jgi:uncharacterized protein YdbL (DUF1318 family)